MSYFQEIYRHHIQLSQIGLVGQKKISQAKVLCVGAGGLGMPVLQYLAASGVGKIGIIDGDVVELSNLQRQVIYNRDDVGQSKAEICRIRLSALNPMITVHSYMQWLNIENIETIFKKYDLILDCTDNFTTHYLINDTARFLTKPYIHASIYQFEGVCTSIAADVMQPCYRCLYPKEPHGVMIPNCQSTGVLGVLPGLVGMIQATEAIKLILGIGENLIGTMLYYDALSLNISKRSYIKNQHCSSCNGSLDLYLYYKKIKKITIEELAYRLNENDDIILLDVRDAAERKIFHIGGYHVLFSALENKFLQLDIDRKKTIVIYCQSGQRSLKAAQQLSELGYDHVMSLDGGIAAWQKKHELFMYTNDGQSEC